MSVLRLSLLITVLLAVTVSALVTTVAPVANASTPTVTTPPKNNTKIVVVKPEPSKDIVNAKTVSGNEDSPKSMKKGDLAKDEDEGIEKIPEDKSKIDHIEILKNSTIEEESPSEDAQDDLGIEDRNGTTIPSYQIPEQPKDVIVKKKRFSGNPEIDYAVDSALVELFGPPATVIEEIAYVDYPDRLFKRSKGVALASNESEETTSEEDELQASVDVVESPIDDVGIKNLKEDSIAVSASEVEASDAKGAPIMLEKASGADRKMEMGDEVTILPANEAEKDFGSSAENKQEMRYAVETPEVAGLIKKSVPTLEKEEPTESDETKSEESEVGGIVTEYSNKDETETEDTKIEKDNDDVKSEVVDTSVEASAENAPHDEGQKEEVLEDLLKDEEPKPEDGAEVVEDTKEGSDEVEPKEETKQQDEIEKADNNDEKVDVEKEENVPENSGAKSDAEVTEDEELKPIMVEATPHRNPEDLPIEPKEEDDNASETEDREPEELPIDEEKPEKLNEVEEGTNEDTADSKYDSGKSSQDEDEYVKADDKVAEDKVLLEAIDPASPEITKDNATNVSEGGEETKEVEDKLGQAAYASEISDDDFSIDHKTGLMPKVDNDDADLPHLIQDGKSESDYNVLEKIQDDVDAASKKEDNPDYIVVEELKDPILGHRKFTILKPTYREFSPKENHLIKEVKETLDKSKVKRSIRRFDRSESAESFEDSYSRDTVIDDSEDTGVLRTVADAMERESDRKSKFTNKVGSDQEPLFVPEGDGPIPINDKKQYLLSKLLGVPESDGPIMIEPEGGIPKEWKQIMAQTER